MSYNIPQQLANLIGATPNDQMHVVAMASPTGVPAPDGSWLSPWTSIQDAVNAIEANYNAGDPTTWFGTIWINPGQYLEDLTITFPGVLTVYTLGLVILGDPPGTTQTITYDVSVASPFGTQAELVFAALSPRPDSLGNIIFPGGILLAGDFFLGGTTNKSISIQNGFVMGEMQEVGGGGLTGELNLILRDTGIGGVNLPDIIYRFDWADSNVLNLGGPFGAGNINCIRNPNPANPPDCSISYKSGRVQGVLNIPGAGGGTPTAQSKLTDVEFEGAVTLGALGIAQGCSFQDDLTIHNSSGIDVVLTSRFSPTAPPMTITLTQAGNNPGWGGVYQLNADGFTNDFIKSGIGGGSILTSPLPPPGGPPTFNLSVIGDLVWP